MELKYGADGWSQWFEHGGVGCPCVGYYAQLVYAEYPFKAEAIVTGGLSWYWDSGYNPILRYRIRKPKGLALLQESLYRLNTVGNYEQTLIGVDR